MQIDSAVGRSARFLARSTNMSDKLDPFDVVALEKAVNDSAVRVSTIWVSYLVFSAFLAIAAGNVTHLQLLLEEAVKLPILNIDLPLVGFFVLAPILFIVFHAYVLIQVVLLARTASVYNEAVERSVKIRSDNARIRQRLTNTLFAQIFAGSPRERERLLGWILRFVAWITLAVAPVFVLLTLEMKFLAYHSLLITWAHRAFISIDLAAVLLLWPLALEPQRDIAWRRLTDHRRTIVAASFMISFAFGIVLLSIIPMSFPTEAHANWTRYVAPPSPFFGTMCDNKSFFSVIFPKSFDRLFLPSENIVDRDKLARIERDTKEKGLQPHQGERTRVFLGRDLSCGTFASADLRRVDLTDVDLTGAILQGADLQGVSGLSAKFRDANLRLSNLRGATLFSVQLQGALMSDAKLQGANLSGAQLQGANLVEAQLQGADLGSALLQGADLTNAQLEGAMLGNAELQGADFGWATLRVALLRGAKLQGANLFAADLRGADLGAASLQGVDFGFSKLDHANLSSNLLWRAKRANCDGAQVTAYNIDALEVITVERGAKRIVKPTSELIRRFIQETVSNLSEPTKTRVENALHQRLETKPEDEESGAPERAWESCAAKAMANSDYETELAHYRVGRACTAGSSQTYIANGIVAQLSYGAGVHDDRLIYRQTFARGLLSANSTLCSTPPELTDRSRSMLSENAQRTAD